MVSNVRAFPSQMTVMSPQPSQQDWVWDGANWCPPPSGGCWPTPPPCPPAGFPTPCPPWYPPPAGQAPWYPGANGGVSFSATAPVNPIRGNFWWDGTVLHLFDGAVWVDIGPAASGALKGVTDGSSAAPGYVGEVIQATSSGTLNVIPPPGAAATSITALVVPPGDWNIQGQVNIGDITAGVYYDEIIFQLKGPTGAILSGFEISGNFVSPNGITSGAYSTAMIPLSVAASYTVTASIQVIAITGGTSGTASYAFTAAGRRMR